MPEGWFRVVWVKGDLSWWGKPCCTVPGGLCCHRSKCRLVTCVGHWDSWKSFLEGWAISLSTAPSEQPAFGPELAMLTHHRTVLCCFSIMPWVLSKPSAATLHSLLWSRGSWQGDAGMSFGAEYIRSISSFRIWTTSLYEEVRGQFASWTQCFD